GRTSGRPDRHRVQPPPVLPLQSAPGAVEGADPGPCVALRLRRRLFDRGDLRQLRAEEGGWPGASADPHRARRGVRPSPSAGLPSGTYVAFVDGLGAIGPWKFLLVDSSAAQPAQPVLPGNLPGSTGSTTQSKLFTVGPVGGGQPRYRVYAVPALAENPQGSS